MASAINFNTVWSATFAPVPTFAFLDRLAAQGGWEQRHGGDRHIIGSDAAGVVVAAGELVRRWDVGDHVTVHGNWVLGEDPGLYRDAMRSPTQRAWGFETNFGGLADFAVVKANQLLTKAPHLTWAEAASSTLCNATAYRMLISPNGAQLRLGDRVLIWGATGGIGSFAVQLAMAAGAEPICVVSRPERVRLLKALGVRHVIDRSAAGFTFTDGRSSGVDHAEVARFRGCVRDMAGDGVDVVFEHPGRETMPASIAACRRGGTVVTCAATTGYGIPWGTGPNALDEVRVIGSHFANYWENDQANELLHRGLVHPTLTCTYPLGEVAEATELVRSGSHDGKVGIDCLGKPGSGITDAVLRARLGEQEVETFARLAQASRVVDRE
jgi:crotonyl-CoA reductase